MDSRDYPCLLLYFILYHLIKVATGDLEFLIVDDKFTTDSKRVDDNDAYRVTWDGRALMRNITLTFSGRNDRYTACVETHVYHVTDCNFSLQYSSSVKYSCGTFFNITEICLDHDPITLIFSQARKSSSDIQLRVYGKEQSGISTGLVLMYIGIGAIVLLALSCGIYNRLRRRPSPQHTLRGHTNPVCNTSSVTGNVTRPAVPIDPPPYSTNQGPNTNQNEALPPSYDSLFPQKDNANNES